MALVTRCLCTLSDCAYYSAVPDHADQCDCKHTDKAHYMHNPCPLYRKNWAKFDENKMDIIKAIRRKKGV